MITVRFFVLYTVVWTLMWMNSTELEASEGEFLKNFSCFKNFIQCEFTRSDAVDYFNGDPYKIVMINLFDAFTEGDILIITGAVKLWVKDGYQTLFVALGVKSLFGYDKVSYFVVEKTDFSTTATELINHPYKERCPWVQYWIDLDS